MFRKHIHIFLSNLQSVNHLFELNPHEFTTATRLKFGHDDSQQFVTLVLKIGQNTSFEEDLYW